MTIKNITSDLQSLNFFPYLDNDGLINEKLHKKIGVYAIFNKNKHIQFIGYSRDIYLSLKQPNQRKTFSKLKHFLILRIV